MEGLTLTWDEGVHLNGVINNGFRTRSGICSLSAHIGTPSEALLSSGSEPVALTWDVFAGPRIHFDGCTLLLRHFLGG